MKINKCLKYTIPYCKELLNFAVGDGKILFEDIKKQYNL